MKKFLDNEYVIWCEFDNAFQNYLQSRCDSLEMSGIPLGIRPPHLTLTFVKTDHIEQLKTITKDFFGLSPNLMIHSVGAFPDGIMYYAPKASAELVGMQKEYVAAINEIAEVSWDLYLPGNWTPHIALTGPLDENMCVAAFSIMMKNFNLLSAEIKTIVIKKCLDGEIVLRHEL